jgi:hypothetical protein
MAEYGEWNRKGATLSEVTAKNEYGVDTDFIIKGIQSGQLEYRQGAIWGNPYLRVLRSQLEKYIQVELGTEYLDKVKNRTELRSIKKEIADLTKKLQVLRSRQAAIEGGKQK